MAEGGIVLVVDDRDDWRTSLCGLLEDSGYRVECAGSKNEALERLTAGKVALAIVDVRLDDANDQNVEGLELVEAIGERWPEVKSLVITGYGTEETVARALQPGASGNRGASDYLPKDQIDKELVPTVARVLAS